MAHSMAESVVAPWVEGMAEISVLLKVALMDQKMVASLVVR